MFHYASLLEFYYRYFSYYYRLLFKMHYIGPTFFLKFCDLYTVCGFYVIDSVDENYNHYLITAAFKVAVNMWGSHIHFLTLRYKT